MNPKIEKLIELANTPEAVKSAQKRAKQYLVDHGIAGTTCATTLSYLLRDAGIDVKVETWAETLATVLKGRGWQEAGNRNPEAGDVAVSKDQNGNNAADHIMLVAGPLPGGDAFLCADNQSKGGKPYRRYASGKGRTPVDYFLRGG